MKKRKKRHRGIIIFPLFLCAVAALAIDSNFRIVTTEYKLPNGRIPESFSNFRVVQLSDLHGKEFGNNNDYLISSVKKADPDLIAITGDLIDDPSQLDWVISLMPRLTALAPVYYVTGNHEWSTGSIKSLFSILDELGVITLRNSYELLVRNGESIVIAGIDDPNGPADMETPPHLIERIREAEGDKYILLLVHRNDWLEKYSYLDVDTALCGHAHGGVVRLPFTDGLIDTRMNWFPTHTSGVYTENNTDMLVSRGLGNTRSFRVLNNPHIPVLILEQNN